MNKAPPALFVMQYCLKLLSKTQKITYCFLSISVGKLAVV